MMEDLLNLAEQQTPQLPEYTVSEISFEIKKFVETAFNRVKSAAKFSAPNVPIPAIGICR